MMHGKCPDAIMCGRCPDAVMHGKYDAVIHGKRDALMCAYILVPSCILIPWCPVVSLYRGAQLYPYTVVPQCPDTWQMHADICSDLRDPPFPKLHERGARLSISEVVGILLSHG